MSDYELFRPVYCICQHAPSRFTYFVYVIELKLPSITDKDAVYVGQSWHTPECRFKQHKENRDHRSWQAYRYGVKLMPALYESLNPLESRTAAENAEAKLADALRGKGFYVISS